MNAGKVFMRFPGGVEKTLTLSYDDGVEQDIRFIEILNKYGIKATFNINSGCYSPEEKVFEEGDIHRRMTHSRAIELYKNSGHEVAVHTYSHPFLEALPPLTVAREVIEDRINLEKDYGKIIRGMAYPFGTLNDTVVDILKNAGIAYARTTVSTEKFSRPNDWLRLPATCHHRNPRLMELAEKFVNMEVLNHARMFYLWGHTYEFDEKDNWNVIEEFCEYMSGRDDIWYATNIEIYDYVKAYESLVWSANLDMVYNPSAIDVFFIYRPHQQEKRIIEVKAGETITF